MKSTKESKVISSLCTRGFFVPAPAGPRGAGDHEYVKSSDPKSPEKADSKAVLPDSKEESPHKMLLNIPGMFRAALGARTMDFQLHIKGSLSSDGSGVYRGFIPLDPSIGVYLEYSSLASIFDEVKLISAEVQMVPVLSSSGSEGATPSYRIHTDVIGGFDRNSINTTTASSDQVVRLDGSQSMTVLRGDNQCQIFRWRTPKDRGYCSTAVPSTIDPPAGCAGLFRYAAVSTVSLNQNYHLYTVKTVLRFRNRV